MLRRWFAKPATPGIVERCDAPEACGAECALAACAIGGRAMVVRVDCSHHDACRLRAMGVYEGARVRVMDTRHGFILDVCGSRLALGAALASAISVLPLAG
jgi:Fe2+ transport system protein FeoA